MTDRKPGEEPSLFDLPLRRTPDGTAKGERDADSNTDSSPEPGAPSGEASGAASAAADAGESRDEPAFWERKPDGDADRQAADAPARPADPTPGLFEEDEGRASPPEEGPVGGEARDPASDWADLEAGEAPDDESGRTPGERPAAVPAALTHRLAASLLDGGILLVVTAGAILGAFLLGVRWQADDLPALGTFLLVFSFVYSVMPLAFWGRTPGMALARVLSRGSDGGPLTFGQTALRWLAGLVTVALAGLPLLLALPALGGRSLADRLSGSHTWLQPDA